MKILGLDLSADQKRKSGICILNGKLKAKTFHLFSDDQILNLAKREKPKIIAIDAPLSFPKEKNAPFRKAEFELLKLKIKVLPLNLPSMEKLTERAINLKKKLKTFEVIEVYPHATREILNLAEKKDKENLKFDLQNLGIKIEKEKLTSHELDAICSAFTGYLYLKGKTKTFGEKREGEIVVPKKEVSFLNCKIDLSKFSFKPREETEFWVKKALRELKKEAKNFKKIKILDIFSGTGCIGIAILKNVKGAKVDFVDINEDAISQIKINLKLNKISPKKYKVILSDIFEKIQRKKYHFIFANPPYVAKERIFEVQESVKKREPKIAWYGGKEGLKYIKKFLKRAKNHLLKGGKIYMEIDPLQKDKIKEILKKEGYLNFQFLKDQFKKIRLVKIW